MSKKESATVAVIDIETDPFAPDRIPKPFVFGFYDGERFREFPTAEKLLEFLRPQKLVVYAHNGGRFDYHYMLDHMEPFSDVMVIAGRLARFKIGECEFRDSWNIIPMALRNFGKDEIDYRKLEPDVRHKHMAEIMRYLRKDCTVLYEIVTKFRAEYGTAMTLAGAAMKYWQAMTNEKAPKSSPAFYNQMKPYYYGGRVECFRAGIIAESFNVFDINSAYPFAMTHEHPIATSYDEVDGFEGLAGKKLQPIGHYFYTVKCVSHGAFPLRDDGKLLFPDDNVPREYHISGWELQAALDTKSVSKLKVLKTVRFGKTINFKQYVAHFFAKKAECKKLKDGPGYNFAKLFQNALYGKFCSCGDNYHNYGVVPLKFAERFVDPVLAAETLADDAHALDLGKHRPPWHEPTDDEPEVVEGFYWDRAGFLGPWALVQGDLTESQHERSFYNVATGASITGFVRAYLWRHLHVLGKRRLYCDTDSIAFVGENDSQFRVGDELGQWSDEGAKCGGFVGGAIAGKKMYAFKKRKPDGDSAPYKIACKGVRLTAEEIYAIARGSVITSKPEVPTYSVHAEPKFTTRKVRRTG